MSQRQKKEPTGRQTLNGMPFPLWTGLWRLREIRVLRKSASEASLEASGMADTLTQALTTRDLMEHGRAVATKTVHSVDSSSHLRNATPAES